MLVAGKAKKYQMVTGRSEERAFGLALRGMIAIKLFEKKRCGRNWGIRWRTDRGCGQVVEIQVTYNRPHMTKHDIMLSQITTPD